MDLSPYVARLEEQLAGFRKVGAVVDLAEAESSAPNPPAAFVVPLGETVQGNPLQGEFTQRVIVRLGIVLALRNLRADSGAAGLVDLECRRDQVRAALAGWSPAPEIGWAQRVGGRLLRYDAGSLWWVDPYLVEFYERTDLP